MDFILTWGCDLSQFVWVSVRLANTARLFTSHVQSAEYRLHFNIEL